MHLDKSVTGPCPVKWATMHMRYCTKRQNLVPGYFPTKKDALQAMEPDSSARNSAIMSRSTKLPFELWYCHIKWLSRTGWIRSRSISQPYEPFWYYKISCGCSMQTATGVGKVWACTPASTRTYTLNRKGCCHQQLSVNHKYDGIGLFPSSAMWVLASVFRMWYSQGSSTAYICSHLYSPTLPSWECEKIQVKNMAIKQHHRPVCRVPFCMGVMMWPRQQRCLWSWTLYAGYLSHMPIQSWNILWCCMVSPPCKKVKTSKKQKTCVSSWLSDRPSATVGLTCDCYAGIPACLQQQLSTPVLVFSNPLIPV